MASGLSSIRACWCADSKGSLSREECGKKCLETLIKQWENDNLFIEKILPDGSIPMEEFPAALAKEYTSTLTRYAEGESCDRDGNILSDIMYNAIHARMGKNGSLEFRDETIPKLMGPGDFAHRFFREHSPYIHCWVEVDPEERNSCYEMVTKTNAKSQDPVLAYPLGVEDEISIALEKELIKLALKKWSRYYIVMILKDVDSCQPIHKKFADAVKEYRNAGRTTLDGDRKSTLQILADLVQYRILNWNETFRTHFEAEFGDKGTREELAYKFHDRFLFGPLGTNDGAIVIDKSEESEPEGIDPEVGICAHKRLAYLMKKSA